MSAASGSSGASGTGTGTGIGSGSARGDEATNGNKIKKSPIKKPNSRPKLKKEPKANAESNPKGKKPAKPQNGGPSNSPTAAPASDPGPGQDQDSSSSSALVLVVDDPGKSPLSIDSSTDSQWQPVSSAGRIRKTSRPKKEPHNRPPLKIAGSAETPNAKSEEKEEQSASGGQLEMDEYNAHLTERIHRLSNHAGVVPMGITRGIAKNELVARFENERTDHFKAEWRKRPEVPTTAELMRDAVDLPVNIIDGPYESVDEYLETHYELLREDAFAGLRDAVGHMRQTPDSDDTQQISIYENVRVLGLTFSTLGVASKVSFSINRAGKNIRWEHSKRLIPGTLVCLSSDDFNTVKVATVAARPLCGLELNPPEVDLLFNETEVEIDTEKVFVMVESKSGYFEAYKWTLRALQRMTVDNFPLHEHLCFLSDNVPPPDYIKKQPIYNIGSIFPDNPDKEALEDVDVIRAWPDDAQTSMDKSQMTALQAILTKQLSIVQGPPGTGKTYISVLALRILLANMSEGDPPIIVACQTNHALDQLLRHIAKYESEFVRLGGRTTDREKIKERTMYEMRQKLNINIQGSGHGAASARMKKHRDVMMKLLDPLKQELLTPEDFCDFGLINATQAKSFTQRAAGWVVVEDDDKQVGGYMGQWLGEYFVPIQIHEPIATEYEDADIEYEKRKEMEAEFLPQGDEIDDRLRGTWFNMGREHTVLEPIGISEAEIQSALQVQNVWDLEEHLRAAVYHYLRKKVIARTWEQVRALNVQYQKCCQEVRISKLEKDAHILSTTKLVGMTTTGLSKYRSIIAAVRPKIVLIEEAAEALEGPVAVACMPGVEHLILVGDHKQLRGHCSVNDLQGDPYFLDISMFERLVTNELPFVTLRTQRRMRPEIREVLTPIYEDKLVDHPSVFGRESIQGMGDINVYWYSHTHPETTDDLNSRVNVVEADMVVCFADYLILNGMDPKHITILTFYAGQRTELSRKIRLNANLGQTPLKVATVDSYQGEENEVILLSLVRSNPGGNIGFLSIENRVCVALSRAKRGFYIFGDVGMITGADKLWWEVGNILNVPPSRIGTSLPLTCQRHKARTVIEDPLDWIDINGGCRKWCKEVLPCRHVCTLRCHAFEHKDIRCIAKCTKFLSCGHQCFERRCYEDCVCQKCGRGQKAIEEAPIIPAASASASASAATALATAPTFSASGVGSSGKVKAITEARPPPTIGPVTTPGQRQFQSQLSNPQVANSQPDPQLVDVDEWEAALPCNQVQQPVMTDQEQFPEMPIAARNPPNNQSQNQRAPQNYPPNYYDEAGYSSNSNGSSMQARGGGVNGPRRQLKDRWPDEDENGQVIDDRDGMDGRNYGQQDNRKGYYDEDRGEYSQKADRRRGHDPESSRGGHGQRVDRGGYRQDGNRGDRGGGYNPESDRGDYDQRGDRGGYSSENNRGGYSQSGDRGGGGYTSESSNRGDYNPRGGRGGYSPRDANLAQERKINAAWPVVGGGGAQPNGTDRGQNSRQPAPWGNRGGSPNGGGREPPNPWGGRGRNASRTAASYTHYK